MPPRRRTGKPNCPTKCKCCATPKRTRRTPKRSTPKRSKTPKRSRTPKRSKPSHYSGQVAQSRETSQARREMAYYFGDMAVYYAKLAKLMSD